MRTYSVLEVVCEKAHARTHEEQLAAGRTARVGLQPGDISDVHMMKPLLASYLKGFQQRVKRSGLHVGKPIGREKAAHVPGNVGAKPPKDTRERLALTPMERQELLSEIRRMFESVNGITQGIAFDDLSMIEKVARGAGTGISANMSPVLRHTLPRDFHRLGMRVHESFARLADDMRAGKSSESALNGLAEITGTCVGCHASYRIVEAYPPVARVGPPPTM